MHGCDGVVTGCKAGDSQRCGFSARAGEQGISADSGTDFSSFWLPRLHSGPLGSFNICSSGL